MKILVLAGAPSAGKTSVGKRVIGALLDSLKISYLKIDVVQAFEDEEIRRDFDIPVKLIYSGDLCPDHASVMVMEEAIEWAKKNGSNLLIVESAGLCLRCSPFLNQGVGAVVISGLSGMNAPLKMRAMIALADTAVTTKIDLVSQAEREVFREKIKEVNPSADIIETNALQGTGLQRFYEKIKNSEDINVETMLLKGVPPLGTCTICIGKRDIGYKKHFGVIRRLEGNLTDILYRGD